MMWESSPSRYIAKISLTTRKEVLTAASRALRQYLAQRPDDPELRQRAAQVYRYTANVYRLGNETEAADRLVSTYGAALAPTNEAASGAR